MDKNEYKTKYDEMKALIEEGKTEEALDLIDSMNWRKVQNVNALVKASEVCEEAGRLEDARDLLYMAHERSPIGRTILYHLAMVCVKLGDYDEAQSYYNEFVEIAPHDSLKYIMKYQICKAKGSDYVTLISILEELKDHDFLEEWSYELAYLYHKTMQIDKCIELCDEIILWFGEGPYVERALEMKMIYQPLDKLQEDKYRSFQQKRDGITEIRANEYLSSGEIVPETIAIPRVELPPERFNTINLQAEIKKNIDEIMRATEAEVVSENMENIKSLVEEIPYLQIGEEEETSIVEQTQAQIDATIMDNFQGYLAEEFDGQISMLVPETKEVESQVEGQMTIEDVMAEWEKTKRAAEAALFDASQQKLESAKTQALKEANQIMDRLEEAIPKLDAGLDPTDLLKEEYLSKEVTEVISETFSIPKVPVAGEMEEIGLEIPVIDPNDIHIIKNELTSEPTVITKEEEPEDTKEWQPPVLEMEEADSEEESDTSSVSESEPEENGLPENELMVEGMSVDYDEASKIVENVNDMLQKEIDKMILESEDETSIQASDGKGDEADTAEDLVEDSIPAEDVMPVEDITENQKELAELAEDASVKENVVEETVVEEISKEEILPEIEEISLDPEELASFVDEKVLEKAIEAEVPQLQLTDEEKEIFSYFMPIAGMEKSICQALTGAKYHVENRKNSSVGNIIIQGGIGSGKTMLASNIIKVLQMETGKLVGATGKIDAKQLNQKDVSLVFSKVAEGCLIIEGASELSETAMENLRQQMMRNDASVLVVLEDEKEQIEKLLSKNVAFAAMFTEKVSIPIFTIDELVNFGKVYALEEGYTVDEMAILAMYNRINMIQRLDQPISLIEVRDIMEDAIWHAERGGIKAALSRFGTKRYDEDGNLILHEQDFEQ